MRIKLSKENYMEFKKKLIQHNVLSSVWDPNQLSDKIGVFTKREYVYVQIQTLSESDDTFLMIKMLDKRYIPFIYNSNEIGINEEKFPKPG